MYSSTPDHTIRRRPPPARQGRFPSAIIEVAKAADDRGYSSVWAVDRLLAPVEPRTPYPASPDGELPEEQRTVLDPILASA